MVCARHTLGLTCMYRRAIAEAERSASQWLNIQLSVWCKRHAHGRGEVMGVVLVDRRANNEHAAIVR